MIDKVIKKRVCGQILNMLENNIMCDNGNEHFLDWCENGDVFRDSYPNESEEVYKEMEELMRKVAPLVDELTYNHLT